MDIYIYYLLQDESIENKLHQKFLELKHYLSILELSRPFLLKWNENDICSVGDFLYQVECS